MVQVTSKVAVGVVSVAAAFVQLVSANNTGYVEFPFSLVKHSDEDSISRNAQLLNDRSSSVLSMPIINEQYYYRIDVGLGTPPQPLQLLIDTGSSDMWVLDGTDPYCASNRLENGTYNATNQFDCSLTGVFDHQTSSTFNIVHDGFRIKYGDHTFAEGSFGEDDFTFGDVTVHNLGFGIGTLANSTIGILGVGLKGNEATRVKNGSHVFTYDNLPIQLKKQGHINKVAYSLFTNSASATSGNLLFGGVDKSKYTGGLWTVPLKNLRPDRSENSTEFTIEAQMITATDDGCHEETVSDHGVTALIDSGTTLTYLPEPIIDGIAKKFDAEFSPDLGGYIQPCSFATQDHYITYYFSGVPIKVNLKETYYPAILNNGKPLTNDEGQEMCILGFTPVKNSRDAILGNSFLRSAYVVFDLEDLEISLAQADVSPKSEPEVEVIDGSVPGAKPASEYVSRSSSNGCGPTNIPQVKPTTATTTTATSSQRTSSLTETSTSTSEEDSEAMTSTEIVETTQTSASSTVTTTVFPEATAEPEIDIKEEDEEATDEDILEMIQSVGGSAAEGAFMGTTSLVVTTFDEAGEGVSWAQESRSLPPQSSQNQPSAEEANSIDPLWALSHIPQEKDPLWDVKRLPKNNKAIDTSLPTPASDPYWAVSQQQHDLNLDNRIPTPSSDSYLYASQQPNIDNANNNEPSPAADPYWAVSQQRDADQENANTPNPDSDPYWAVSQQHSDPMWAVQYMPKDGNATKTVGTPNLPEILANVADEISDNRYEAMPVLASDPLWAVSSLPESNTVNSVESQPVFSEFSLEEALNNTLAVEVSVPKQQRPISSYPNVYSVNHSDPLWAQHSLPVGNATDPLWAVSMLQTNLPTSTPDGDGNTPDAASLPSNPEPTVSPLPITTSTIVRATAQPESESDIGVGLYGETFNLGAGNSTNKLLGLDASSVHIGSGDGPSRHNLEFPLQNSTSNSSLVLPDVTNRSSSTNAVTTNNPTQTVELIDSVAGGKAIKGYEEPGTGTDVLEDDKALPSMVNFNDPNELEIDQVSGSAEATNHNSWFGLLISAMIILPLI